MNAYFLNSYFYWHFNWVFLFSFTKETSTVLCVNISLSTSILYTIGICPVHPGANLTILTRQRQLVSTSTALVTHQSVEGGVARGTVVLGLVAEHQGGHSRTAEVWIASLSNCVYTMCQYVIVPFTFLVMICRKFWLALCLLYSLRKCSTTCVSAILSTTV